ncbi:MAG: D-alanyl-D-alanine carboxypeptidase family protein [Mesorhizobium sp.]|nr:D-alanyl-D-alanine carboxypeptidase family protein [Mesorhizobium sp.]
MLVLVTLSAFGLAACSTTPTEVLTVAPIPSEKYAAIVVDANSGRTLYASAADQLRYPASLTKMMTLYMMFEAIDSGRMSKSTQIPVSAYAASRPPTKMGIKPGGTIDADTAIRALVTRSANDVAAAVGEYLGGTEAQFAANMTARARQLGMTRTTFRNASGLPDADQQTCARDMALLGMALRQRFPHHYAYFSTREFAYAGKMVRGHNKLLETGGVDGIKTGYIRASGFNVVTSVNRDGKRLVVAVMGGESADSRNAHVQGLIARYLPSATSRGGAAAASHL